jgi:Ca-activated chloride channel homolog
MKAFAALLALVFLVTPWERAARLVEAGDLEGAEREYRQLLETEPDNPALHYDLGTVLLLQGRYDDARPHLAATADAEGDLEAEAAYNLGATDLEPAYADTALADRDDRLRRAITAYKDALLADPADVDAKWNLELARRLLERDTPPPSGGGGGGGGGSGGGEGPPEPGNPQPMPQPGGGPGPEPEMSRAEAEELLDAAQEQELEVQQETLRKPQPAGPIRP